MITGVGIGKSVKDDLHVSANAARDLEHIVAALRVRASVRGLLTLALLVAAGCNRSIESAENMLPTVGAELPAFEFKQLDGTRLSPSQLVGQPTVVAFWSSTCGSSRLAFAAMVALREDYATRGVRMLVIADDTAAVPVQRILDSAGVQLPIALAAGQITAIFSPRTRWPWRILPLPSFLLLDAAGRVRHRVVGVERDSTRRLARVRHALDAMLLSVPSRRSASAR